MCVRACMRVCVCMRMCEFMCARARARVCVCVCLCACLCACLCMGVLLPYHTFRFIYYHYVTCDIVIVDVGSCCSLADTGIWAIREGGKDKTI